MRQHVGFLVVDTDVLESAKIEDGHVFVADIAAPIVLVPPMRVVEAPLQRWLDQYQAQGGRVIWCDRDVGPAELSAMVQDTVKPSLSVRDGAGEVGDILSVKRVGPQDTLWYLLHTGDRGVDVELDCGTHLREVHLGPNAVPSLRFSAGRYLRTVAPYEAFMVAASGSPGPARVLPRLTVHLGGEAALEVGNHNLLRMGEWHLSLLDEGGSPGPSAVVSPMPLPNQLEHGRLAFAPEYAAFLGNSDPTAESR